MSRFWSSMVKDLDPYKPGEQPQIKNIIKLNTNENPYGPSPMVISAILGHNDQYLKLYPDPQATSLKNAVADYYQVKKDQIFVGNGSDEVLAFVFQAFFMGKAPIVFPDITYSFYPVYCGLYGVEFKTVPVNEKFEIEASSLCAQNGGVIFPNPNAPTGIFMPLPGVEEILILNPDVVVVVDEAYVDFGGQSVVTLVDKYPNLLVVQTLSKSRSLAGLRVGLAIGQKDLIEGLERVKNCFNSYPLDRLAIAGAAAAFEDREYFDKVRQKVINSRERLASTLEAMRFNVLPSAANFVFASHNKLQATVIAARLREMAIVVRYFDLPRIDNYLRITVGTDEQIDTLLAELEKIVR